MYSCQAFANFSPIISASSLIDAISKQATAVQQLKFFEYYWLLDIENIRSQPLLRYFYTFLTHLAEKYAELIAQNRENLHIEVYTSPETRNFCLDCEQLLNLFDVQTIYVHRPNLSVRGVLDSTIDNRLLKLNKECSNIYSCVVAYDRGYAKFLNRHNYKIKSSNLFECANTDAFFDASNFRRLDELIVCDNCIEESQYYAKEFIMPNIKQILENVEAQYVKVLEDFDQKNFDSQNQSIDSSAVEMPHSLKTIQVWIDYNSCKFSTSNAIDEFVWLLQLIQYSAYGPLSIELNICSQKEIESLNSLKNLKLCKINNHVFDVEDDLYAVVLQMKLSAEYATSSCTDFYLMFEDESFLKTAQIFNKFLKLSDSRLFTVCSLYEVVENLNKTFNIKQERLLTAQAEKLSCEQNTIQLTQPFSNKFSINFPDSFRSILSTIFCRIDYNWLQMLLNGKHHIDLKFMRARLIESALPMLNQIRSLHKLSILSKEQARMMFTQFFDELKRLSVLTDIEARPEYATFSAEALNALCERSFGQPEIFEPLCRILTKASYNK